MKIPILLGALLLSGSPVVAQDIVVLECPVSIHTTLIDPETSNVVDSHKQQEIGPFYFTVDFKNNTLDGGGPEPGPVEIKDGQVMFEEKWKDGSIFNMTIKVNPPGEFLATSKGTQLINGKLFKVLSSFNGTCTRFDR